MKVLMLSPSSNIHTRRWANGLASRGIEVHLASQHEKMAGYSSDIRHYSLPFTGTKGYILNVFALRRIIKEVAPDLMSVHYASGYGTLAMLSKFKPIFLSVWGSDIFEFPKISFLHKRVIMANLAAAFTIGSTSHVMGREIQLYKIDDTKIFITPFGVDHNLFSKIDRQGPEKEIRVGTIKTLSPKYGIDILLRAFQRVLEMLPIELSQSVRLIIAGEGESEAELKQLAKELCIDKFVEFMGRIPHENVPKALSNLDVFCALSRSESFGVAVIEASSCCVPVVVSNAGGLPEVVENGRTGYIVGIEDVSQSAEAIYNLIMNKGLREEMGRNGRRFVEEAYSWEYSLDVMIDALSYVKNNWSSK